MTTINTNTSATTAFVVTPDTTGTFVVNTGSGAGATAMTLDSSQNIQFNSGYGSVATAYGCRAWVNFNGTGTVAIRASGNVSSITDNGVGDYTVNFTNSMPDANYAMVVTARSDNDNVGSYILASQKLTGAKTTSACQISTRITTTATDSSEICTSFFR